MGRRDERTLDFFAVPEVPVPTGGSLDCAAELCIVLADMITDAIRRKVIRSRHDLAARLSELTGKEITKAQIDAWTAESKEAWRFPFEYAPAFEAACDSTALQEFFGRKRGTRILVGKETLLAKLGWIHNERAKLADEERAIKSQMRGRR